MPSKLAYRVLRRYVVAREFPSDKAMQEYLREHPKADPKVHWVREEEEKRQKEEKEHNVEDFARGWSKDRASSMKEYREKEYEHTPLEGKLGPEKVKSISKHAKGVLATYAKYLPGDDVGFVRDFIDEQTEFLEGALKEGAFKGAQAEKVNKLMMRAVDDLVYQTHESYKRQLGDHGARHIVSNIKTQNDAFKALEKSGVKISAKDKFMAAMVMVNHDLGYTAAPSKANVKYTGKHKEYSDEIFRTEYEDDYREVFDEDSLTRLKTLIKTHDSPEMDWENDPVGSSIRLADNLSLYSQEKLPGLFRLIPGGIDTLEEIGKAAKEKDQKKIDEVRAKLHKKIDDASIPAPLKKALKNAAEEVNVMTAKFTLGMLGGKLDKMEFKDGTMQVHVKRDVYDERLQKLFDLGQRQFGKLADAYGISEEEAKKDKKFTFGDKDKPKMVVSLED